MMENKKIEKVKFVSKGFGTPKVIHNGYIYISRSVSLRDSATVFWRCSVRNCNGRIHTLKDCLIKITGDHNHEAPNPLYLQKVITRANLKKMAVQTNDIPSKIVKDVLSKDEEVIKGLPAPVYLKRMVRKTRKTLERLSKLPEKVKVPELDPLYATTDFMVKNCEKTFTNVTDLKEYIKTHTKEKPFKCDLCERSFHDRRELNVHMIFHSQMKPFQCVQCFVVLNDDSQLKEHTLSHTDDKLLKHKQQDYSVEIGESKVAAHLEDHNYFNTKKLAPMKSGNELGTNEFDEDMLEFEELIEDVKIEPMSYEVYH